MAAPSSGVHGPRAAGLGNLERNLPQHYDRLAVAIAATSLGIWEWDVERGEVYWSDRQREIFGVGKDAAVDYRLWISRLHPGDAARVEREARQLLDPLSGGGMHSQHRLLLPNGEVRWIESHGRMLYQDGRAIRLLGTVTDITARKRTEDALVQSLSALEVTLDAADAVPWQYNVETRELRWSHRVTALFGLSDGEGFPTMDDFLAHVHPDEQALLAATRAAERDAAPGEKFTLQLRLRKDGGSWRWIERRSIAGHEEPSGRWIYGVDLDISERKKANEQLKETIVSLARERERLEIALLAGKLGVYEWRIGEGSVWWSPEVYPVFGVDPATFTPTVATYDALIHPQDLAEVKRKTEEALERRANFEHEYRIVRPDGGVRWIASRWRASLDAKGEAEFITGVAFDITGRKRQEEQVLLLMREVNHRSKNLLAVVQAIASQSAQASDPEIFAKRFGERLQGLAASLDLLVHNNWGGVAVRELVTSQLSYFRDMLGSRFVIHGPEVMLGAAAAQAIGMALHELVTNASKYGALSNTGGTVWISWEIAPDPMPRFAMRWEENGGPAVSPPARRGFGTSITTAVLMKATGGKALLDYRPGGLVWTFEAPLEDL